MLSTLHPMLNVAVRAARAAGTIINRAALDVEAVRVAQKQANDFVTEVDQASEAAIIETLLTAYPGHGILAEESGRTQGDAHSDRIWIIDPLDGTTNFIHGFPVYCVSIALQVAGRIEQAVVYDPTRNDLFTATRGRGAFLNDRRIRVSKRANLNDCLIATGFPFRPGDDYDAYLKMMGVMMRSTVGLRRPGSAALDLAYVAAGFSDGFFEAGLKPWDVAAGSLLVTEAGGLMGNFAGDALQLDVPECLAANPRVYAQMVKLLARYSRAEQWSPAPALLPDTTAGESTEEPPAAPELAPSSAIAEPADELAIPINTVLTEEPAQPAASAEASPDEPPAPSEPVPQELAPSEPAPSESELSEPVPSAEPADLPPQRPRLRAAPRRAPEPGDAFEPRYGRADRPGPRGDARPTGKFGPRRDGDRPGWNDRPAARSYGKPGAKPAGRFGPRRDGDGPGWNDRPAPRPYGKPGAKPAGRFGPRRDGDGPGWSDRPAPRPYGQPGAKPAGRFGPRRDGDGPGWSDRPAPRPYGQPGAKPAGKFGPRRDDGGPAWGERPAFRDRPSRPAQGRPGADERRDSRADRYPASPPRRTDSAPRGKPYAPRGPRSDS